MSAASVGVLRWYSPAVRLIAGLAALFALALLGGCQPMGPIPGGELDGTVIAAPADWTALNSVDTVQLETRPEQPYSVNVWGAGIGGSYYLAAGRGETSWTKHIDANPNVRLRIGESIYELKAVRVQDAEELKRVRAAYEAKYEMSDDQREQTGSASVFRLEPR